MSDRLNISGLTGPGTVAVTLYGPVPPVRGEGCAGVDWSDVGSLPVARVFDPVTVFDDSSIDTPGLVLDEPGCYSLGASVDPLIGDPVGFPPGAEAETLRVLPKLIPPPFTVTTHASSNVTGTGTRIFDRVTVRGLLPGRSIIVTSTLYGPLPPASDGTCSGIGWEATGLPIAARLAPFRVGGNGTFPTPSVRVTRPGCYSFDTVVTHNQVTGGEERVGHGLGAPDEVVLVRSAARDAAARDPARGSRPSHVALAKSGDSVTVRGGLSGRYGNRSVTRSTSHTPRRSRERSTHLTHFRDRRHVRSVRSSR